MTSAASSHAPARETRAPAFAGDDDLTFCRVTLPRVSRTFALNIRLLGGEMRDVVGIGYLLCRAADTLEDAWPGGRTDIERRFARLRDAMAGDEGAALGLAAEAERAAIAGPARGLMTGLPRVWRRWQALAAHDRADVAECVTAMAAGMSRYAGRMAQRLAALPGLVAVEAPPPVSYLDSEEELHDYCWIVAGCVGVMLTRLFARRAALTSAATVTLLRLAPAVGEGLQLTNILLDWPADVRSGRCHVPSQWLAELGLRPTDLVGGVRPEVSTLAGRLEVLARAALHRVPDYLAAVPTRHFRYRQFCAWPALWALASLRHARTVPGFPSDPLRPRLPRARLWSLALRSAIGAHGVDGTRRLFAAVSGA